MINLSNVLSLQARQDYKVNKQKEKNNQTENPNIDTASKLVLPSAEHLKAKYLSFGAEKDEKLGIRLGASGLFKSQKQSEKYVFPPFLTDMLSKEDREIQIRFKPYDKTADLVAQSCYKGNNSVILHENGSMPALAANSFASMLIEGKFKNLGMTKENTEVHFVEADVAMMHMSNSISNTINERVKEEGPGADFNEIAMEEQQKPNPDIQNMQKMWENKINLEGKKIVLFISDPSKFYFQALSPDIKIVSFVETKPKDEEKGPSIISLISGKDMDDNDDNKDLPKAAQDLLKNDPTAEVLDLPLIGAPEAKSFIKKHWDNLIPLPDGFGITYKAIDGAVDRTKKLEGAYPGKALELINNAVPAVLREKRINKDAQYSIITDKNIQKAEKSYPEVFEEEKDFSEKSYNLLLDTKTKLKDVGGIDQIEDNIRETLIDKIQKRKMKNSDVFPPSNILIAGGAGSGKTVLAKAIAGETNSPFVHVSALKMFDSLLISRMKGSTDTSEIGEAFDFAKSAARDSDNKTAILFIDDLDVMVDKYNKLQHPILEEKNAKDIYFAEMLKQIKSIDNKKSDINIVVLASCRYPQLMQEEFNKTGLFNTQIQVPDNANSLKTRISTINLLTKDMKFESPEEKEKVIKETAKVTDGASGAELKTIINKAGLIVDKRKENKHLTINDVLESLLEIEAGPITQLESEDWKKEHTIKHELGHAVVMQSLMNMSKEKWQRPNEINFITFDPRGRFGGAVFHGPGENGALTYDSLINRIAGSFGGYSVEKTLFKGRITDGPYYDLENINGLAEAGVQKLALGHFTGPVANPKLMMKENKKDITTIIKTGEKISEMVIDFHKDFINEYGDECFGNLGKGGNTMSASVFQGRMKDWLGKEDRRKKLKLLETKIQILTDVARVKGKFIDDDKKLTKMAKEKLSKKAN